MTPEDLETRLAGQPDSATVAAAVAELRVDRDWSVTELTLAGQPAVIELLHHPSGTAYTLRHRRDRAPQQAQGGQAKEVR